MAEKRVAIRVLFHALDTVQLAELMDALETLVEEYGKAEVEATILPDLPRPE